MRKYNLARKAAVSAMPRCYPDRRETCLCGAVKVVMRASSVAEDRGIHDGATAPAQLRLDLGPLASFDESSHSAPDTHAHQLSAAASPASNAQDWRTALPDVQEAMPTVCACFRSPLMAKPRGCDQRCSIVCLPTWFALGCHASCRKADVVFTMVLMPVCCRAKHKPTAASPPCHRPCRRYQQSSIGFV